MRSYLAIFFSMISLAGCVNYVGLKSDAKPYDANTLSAHHVYSYSKKSTAFKQANWWNKFHDPQLNELIQTALSDSPDMLVAQSRVNLARHVAETAGATLWPSISLDGSVSREHYTNNGLIPPPFNNQTISYGYLGLNFQYELDFWGKNRQTLAARCGEARAAEADAAESRIIISTAVASTYFQLQSAIVELQTAEAILRQRQALARIVVYRTSHEIESDIPLTTASAEEQIAEITVMRYKQDVLTSRHQLAALLGKNPFTTQIKLRPFVYNERVLSLPHFVPMNLLGRRPDITASRWRVEAANHQINVAKARFYPDLNLTAFLSYQSIGLNQLFNKDSADNNIQGAFDLPIFDANARRGNLKTRFAEYDVAVNNYNQTILSALRDVADQMSILYTVKSQQASQARVLNQTKKTYALTQSRYRHGIIDYSQLLEVQGNLLNQQLAQIQLQASHVLTMVAMMKALGGDYQSAGVPT